MGSLSLLLRIFPTQGLNPGLPNCRQMLYQLNHKGNPRILVWVAYLFFGGSSQPRNWTRVFHIAGGFFTNWAIKGNSLWKGIKSTYHFHLPLLSFLPCWAICQASMCPVVGIHDQKPTQSLSSQILLVGETPDRSLQQNVVGGWGSVGLEVESPVRVLVWVFRQEMTVAWATVVPYSKAI